MQISRTLLNKHFLMSRVSLFEPKPALTVKPNETVRQTLDKLRAHHVGSALVMNEEDSPLGIFTERDVITRIALNEPGILAQPISDIMTSNVQTVDLNTSVARTLQLLAAKGFRNVPIITEQKTPLMITTKEVVDYIYNTLTKVITESPDWTPDDDNCIESYFGSPIDILAPSKPLSTSSTTSIADTVAMMSKEKVGSIIISDQDKKISGIFTERDYLNKGVNLEKDRQAAPISEIMTSEIVTLQHTLSVAFAYNAMSEGNFRHIPVVNFENGLVGVLSIRNFLRSLTDSMIDEFSKPQPKDPALVDSQPEPEEPGDEC